MRTSPFWKNGMAVSSKVAAAAPVAAGRVCRQTFLSQSGSFRKRFAATRFRSDPVCVMSLSRGPVYGAHSYGDGVMSKARQPLVSVGRRTLSQVRDGTAILG